MELAKQIPEPEVWGRVDQVGKTLMRELESPQMVITLGPEGMQLFEGSASLKLPTFAKKVFDVTGAGDTVIATFALAQSAGWSLTESAVVANAAAGVVVGYVGAVACSQSELHEALETQAD
jgi:bifunctional ADP-heptose synthase (sugar kinase/adenylyltransferase)